MSRNKAVGTEFERRARGYFREWTGLDVGRRGLAGAADEGDLALTVAGEPVAVECKSFFTRGDDGSDHKRNMAGWCDEAAREAANLGTSWWVLLHKRGNASDHEQYATTSWRVLAALVTEVEAAHGLIEELTRENKVLKEVIHGE